MSKIKPFLLFLLYFSIQTAVSIFVMFLLMLTMPQIRDSYSSLTDMIASGADSASLENAVDIVKRISDDAIFNNIAGILGVVNLLTLIVCSLLFRVRGIEFFSAAKISAPTDIADVGFGLALGAGFGVISSLLLSLLSNINFFNIQLSVYESSVSNPIVSSNLIASIIGIGLAAPLLEEVVYRGMLTRDFRASGYPVAATIILQAALFALMHLNIIQMTYTFPLGIILGYCVYKTQTIWTGVAVHVGLNMTSVLVSSTVLGEFAFSSDYGMNGWYVILSVALFCVGLSFFIKRKKSPEFAEIQMERRVLR